MKIEIGTNLKSLVMLVVILVTAGLALADTPLSSTTVYSVTCASTSHGTTLKSSDATVPVPRTAIKVKNEDAAITIRIGPPSTLDGSDNGWEIAPGNTESIESPVTLWNCRGDSGSPKMKVMGGT